MTTTDLLVTYFMCLGAGLILGIPIGLHIQFWPINKSIQAQVALARVNAQCAAELMAAAEQNKRVAAANDELTTILAQRLARLEQGERHGKVQ